MRRRILIRRQIILKIDAAKRKKDNFRMKTILDPVMVYYAAKKGAVRTGPINGVKDF